MASSSYNTNYGSQKRRYTNKNYSASSTSPNPYYGGQKKQRVMSNRRRNVTLYTGSFAPETKYFDVGINAVVTVSGATWADSEVPADNYVNASGSPASYTDSCLLPTAIGSAYGQVNGNRYHLKKLRVRGILSPGALTDQDDAANAPIIRIVLVMDTQPNGAQAQGEDIIQDFGTAAENAFAFMSMAACSGRFKIIDSLTMVAPIYAASPDGTNTSSQRPNTINFSLNYIPRKPKVVNIKSGSSTPTIASTVDCNMFLLAYSANIAGVRPVTVTGCSRAYYCD